MRNLIFPIFTGFTVSVMALALSATPAQAASAPETQLHQLQVEVNNATKTPQQWETAMHTISVQTGVPWSQLSALRQKYPTVDPSAVLISSVLADQTKKAPEQFLKEAIAGQSWVQIARNNNVPLEKIDARLERIQQALVGEPTSKYAQVASAPETQLHQLQLDVDNATKTTQQWETAMHTISVQTGVPASQLSALRQKYPNVDPSAVLIASVLADQTKKAPEQFIEEANAGQTWVQIARNNNVPLEKINARLQRVQQALGGGPTNQWAQGASTPETQLHQLQLEVNNATKTTQQWETAMHTISVQTGVPWSQLSALRQKYPNVDPSAVLIASVLADQTKKAPEQFLKEATAGQTWVQIARDNNVPLEKINARLERIQQALVAGAAAQPTGKAGS